MNEHFVGYRRYIRAGKRSFSNVSRVSKAGGDDLRLDPIALEDLHRLFNHVHASMAGVIQAPHERRGECSSRASDHQRLIAGKNQGRVGANPPLLRQLPSLLRPSVASVDPIASLAQPIQIYFLAVQGANRPQSFQRGRDLNHHIRRPPSERPGLRYHPLRIRTDDLRTDRALNQRADFLSHFPIITSARAHHQRRIGRHSRDDAQCYRFANFVQIGCIKIDLHPAIPLLFQGPACSQRSHPL